jgi:GntR family transcriptional regulator
MIHIDPRDGVPIYRQVMDQIKLQITAGQLAAGQQLESVSNLSARLKVNPMTISKAYGFLVEEGVVERRKGVGIFVAKVKQEKIDRDRQRVLGEALRDVAGLAVQLGIQPEEAVQIFRRHLAKFQGKKGSQS